MSDTVITTSSDPAGAISLLPVGSHAGRPGIPLPRALTIIGRRPGVHLRLGSRQVSRAHAVLLHDAGAMYLRDLSTRTHTFVNGHEKRSATLRNGDQIRIGRFTFRFISTNGVNGVRAPVKLAGMPVPQLVVRDMPPFVLCQPITLIGRGRWCDVLVNDPDVSTAHAIIYTLNGRRFVRDLQSRTGTYVNGQPVEEAEIRPGDVIGIGDRGLQYLIEAQVHQHEIAPVAPVAAAGAAMVQKELLPPLPEALLAPPRVIEPLPGLPQPVEPAAAAIEIPEPEPCGTREESGPPIIASPEPASQPASQPLVAEPPVQALHSAITLANETPTAPPVRKPEREPEPIDPATLGPILPISGRIDSPSLDGTATFNAGIEEHLPQLLDLPEEITEPEPQPIDPANLDPILPISGRIDSPSLDGSATFDPAIEEHLPQLLDLASEPSAPEPEIALLSMAPVPIEVIEEPRTSQDGPVVAVEEPAPAADEAPVPEPQIIAKAAHTEPAPAAASEKAPAVEALRATNAEMPPVAIAPQPLAPLPIAPLATLQPPPVEARPAAASPAEAQPLFDETIAFVMPTAPPTIALSASPQPEFVETQSADAVAEQPSAPEVSIQTQSSAPDPESLIQSTGPLGILPQQVDVQKQTIIGADRPKLPLPSGTQKWGPVGLAMVLSNPGLLEPRPALPPARRESAPSQAVRHPRKRWLGLFLTATIAVAAAGVLAWQLIMRLVP